MTDADGYRLAPCGCLVRSWNTSIIVKPCFTHKEAIEEDKKKDKQ